MGLPRSNDGEARFSAYVEGLTSVIGHADRAKPLRDYCLGLMMPCERKSVEPMAAITAPERAAAQQFGCGCASHDGATFIITIGHRDVVGGRYRLPRTRSKDLLLARDSAGPTNLRARTSNALEGGQMELPKFGFFWPVN